MRLYLILTGIVAMSLLASCSGFALNITGYKGPESVIVVGKDAIEAERYAAKEFAKYIKCISGYALPVSDVPVKNKVTIFIGQTTATRNQLQKFNWKSLKTDGIVIKTSQHALVLAGDRPRGSLYAVYTFLENYLGCKWWSYGCEYVPTSKKISIGNINLKYVPPFMMRESYFRPNMTDTAYPIKMKLNGHFNKIPVEMGGHYEIIGFVHTFDNYIPYSVYGKEHPEWFTYADGKRLSGVNQLCLSNEEMVHELIKNVLQACRKNPDAGIISVSMNDNYRYCRCDKCNALAEKYGGQSGLMLHVVNQVADAVKKEFPNFYVDTLAYLYTRAIPKGIIPRDNVVIRLCSIECNFGANLKDASNKAFYNDLTQWSKISRHLFVWDYVCNFLNYHIAHPNFHILADNINIYADNNVTGIFEQGDSASSNAGFNRLKGWLIAKLLWDPSQDPKKLIMQFLRGYYGDQAAPYLNDFLNYTEKLVIDKKVNLSCYMHTNDWMTPDEMITCLKYLNKALDTTSTDSVFRKRVLAERLAFQVAWLISPEEYRDRVAKSGELQYSTRKDFINAYGAFCRENGNYNFSESQPLAYSILGVNLNPDMKKTAKIPAECTNLSDMQWYDIQDNELELPMGERWAYRADNPDASDGKCIVLLNNHIEWAVQKKLYNLALMGVKKADIYASIKVKKLASSGAAFGVGLYDDASKTTPLDMAVDLKDLPENQYVSIKLGTFDISEKLILFFAPGGKPDLTESISIDRIFIIPK